MTTTTAVNHAAPITVRVGRARALGVVAATLAAVSVWAVAVLVLGAHLLVRFGTGAPQTVGIDFVVGGSLVASLCAWGFLALLERRTARGRTVWTVVALVVLLVSLSLPLAAGIAVSTKVTLATMHMAVAVVLIPSLRRSRSAQPQPPSPSYHNS